MAVSEKCDRVAAILERIKRYDAIIRNNSFTNSALDEMKDNAKAIVDEANTELDLIKSEVDTW